MIKAKFISSLSRAFIDTKFDDLNTLVNISALKGERLSIQLVTEYIKDEGEEAGIQKKHLSPICKGELAEYASLRRVDNVAVELPCVPEVTDEHFERTAPGLYPDVLAPLTFNSTLIAKRNITSAVWIDIEIPEDTCHTGHSVFTVELMYADGSPAASASIDINVINAVLPEQTLLFTNWFHCDCLAEYYDCEPFGERHWQIVENFARAAHRNGLNVILTPTFTPPLDTQVGGERLTTQLVGVRACGGKYSFDFSLVDRWVDMCDRIGIKYFEIAHIFTQWGAKHAPKIMATVDGEYKKIFGWETDASSEEYISFIRQFLTEFIAHMKKNGNDKRCMFHISDEPELKHLEFYMNAKNSVADVLEGYTIMDALSNFEFYKKGIVETPIPVNDSIEPFLEAGVKGLWTYYCWAQSKGVSNRLVAMPPARNRSIGMQMYKYDIVGFLHWGFNFYNNQFSLDGIEPYTNISADHWVPAGDAYSVYPGPHGMPKESPRLAVFHEGLQDMRAMQLCETYYKKEEIVAEIEKILGTTLTFSVCAYDESTMLKIRERINSMIEAKVK